ncbi:MAG TPA: hemolysin family protein [Rhizomicrobium sp.]|jgi:CBS domain containing-hemolysin-like protein|nr:hemolysin family protein [Rhizomicrobium sp.]
MADSESKPANASFFHRLSQILRRGNGSPSILQSVEQAIEESDRQSDALTPQERVMLGNLLRFGELRIDDVMVPRADIIAVDESVSLRDLVAVFREAQHSRLPIYRETLDDPTGVIHIKDAVALLKQDADGSLHWPDVPISSIKRDVLFVPPSMPARDLLFKMQSTHSHLALVIDEYGGTDGLVSIEDLIEEIVGDIDDEHDVEELQVRPGPNGAFDADARIDLDELKEKTGLEFAMIEDDQEIDTLGGLVVSLLSRVPQRGEIVTHPDGYEFEVLEADPRRIKRVRIRRTVVATPEGGPG